MRNLKINQVIAIVLLMVALLLCTRAFGTAVDYPVQYSDNFDSVRVWLWKDWVIVADTTTATGLDSIGYSSFPVTDTLVLDDASDYEMKTWYYFTGNTTPMISTVSIKFTGGSIPGTGPYTISMLTVDTLGTDSIVEGVVVTVTNLSTGVPVRSQTSLATGFTYWNLGTTSYEIKGKKTRYAWAFDTVTYSADSTDTLEGYNVSISAATGDSTCNVYGTAVNIDGSAAEFARVVFTLKGEAVDTCNDVTIANFSVETNADEDGLFQQELIYSACLSGKKYNRKIFYQDGSSSDFTFTVPSESTYEITGQ